MDVNLLVPLGEICITAYFLKFTLAINIFVKDETGDSLINVIFHFGKLNKKMDWLIDWLIPENSSQFYVFYN